MDFSLNSLSDAFRKAEYQSARQDFLLFCFILATPADNNIFPKLFDYFPELHELTSRYILVISPRIHVGRQVDVSGQVDISGMVEDFLKRQTSETIKFARFCGIGVDKIPCIVFFASLKNPDQYVIWELKNQDATSAIKDFRTIVAKVEEACSEVTYLDKSLEELNRRRRSIEWDMEKEKEEIPRRIQNLEKKLKSRKERLLYLQNAPRILETYISKTQYQTTPELEEIIKSIYENLMSRFRDINNRYVLLQTNALPLGRLSKKLHQLVLQPHNVSIENYIRRYTIGSSDLEDLFRKYLDTVRLQKIVEIREPIYTDSIIKLVSDDVEYCTNKLKSEREKNLDNFKNEIEKIDRQIAEIKQQKQKLDLPDLLDAIHSLDNKRYVRRVLSNLGRSIPILNLGLSTANVFE